MIKSDILCLWKVTKMNIDMKVNGLIMIVKIPVVILKDAEEKNVMTIWNNPMESASFQTSLSVILNTENDDILCDSVELRFVDYLDRPVLWGLRQIFHGILDVELTGTLKNCGLKNGGMNAWRVYAILGETCVGA